MPVAAKTTQILIDRRKGEPSAADRLMPLVYDELRALAARCMEEERANHTLQATALVHEAYLKLIDQSRVDWKNRAHFFAVAAGTIRRLLVDHARQHVTAKRGERVLCAPGVAQTGSAKKKTPISLAVWVLFYASYYRNRAVRHHSMREVKPCSLPSTQRRV